ncbi:MAG: hypothetical protein U0W40_17625 [Acidimicrobiia bacterium]
MAHLAAGAPTFSGRTARSCSRDTGVPAVYVANADGSGLKMIGKSGADARPRGRPTQEDRMSAGKGSEEIFVTDATADPGS